MHTYTFILLIILSNFTFGQNSEEAIESHIKSFEKELRKKNIDDFFAVKHIQYGVSRITKIDDIDYCNKNQVYYRLFAFWKENNVYWLKVFDNCGGFIPIKLDDGSAYNFYLQNFEKIKFEEVERYKIRPDAIANGNMSTYSLTQNHAPLRYFWFYKDSIIVKKFINTFDLTTSQKNPNISYDTNKRLALYRLNGICEKIIKKYVKTKNLIREE